MKSSNVARSLPDEPIIKNIDSLLQDIYSRYIAIDSDLLKEHYDIVHDAFLQICNRMDYKDKYFGKYFKKFVYAGSYADKLKINKPDEFDIDIMIGLPISTEQDSNDPERSDFVIKSLSPGYVQLKMGRAFERSCIRMPKEVKSQVFRWKDHKTQSLLRSKFKDWFKGLVDEALNIYLKDGSPVIDVKGKQYTVRRSESGPATTLFIENEAENFKLDVDLVPALLIPTDRWPIGHSYRPIHDWSLTHRLDAQSSASHRSTEKRRRPDTQESEDYWLLVPKPIKSSIRTSRLGPRIKDLSWRIGMPEQEYTIMYDMNNMKQAIRLMKKFRDAQKMDEIASYYIKTMFFWEALERGYQKEFWNNSPAYLFKYMLNKFYMYLVDKKLPYFWHSGNNFFRGIDEDTLKEYELIIEKLLDILNKPAEYKIVAKYLLSEEEFKEYNEKYLHI